MNCSIISKKALQLGLTKFDIDILKSPFNGFEIITLNEDKEKEIKELTRYISQNEYKKKPKQKLKSFVNVIKIK